jgi:hypothetical protein
MRSPTCLQENRVYSLENFWIKVCTNPHSTATSAMVIVMVMAQASGSGQPNSTWSQIIVKDRYPRLYQS